MAAPALGVNIASSYDTAKMDRDCRDAAKYGFPYVRVSYENHWSGNLAALQKACDIAANYGLKVIQCCQGMEARLARGGRAGHYGPKDQQSADEWGTWFAACANIVDSTGLGGVTSCLNEPDNYGWDTTPSVTDVATLHSAALNARDRDAPGTIFVTGEMAPGDNPDPLVFLKAIAAAAPVILTDDHVWIGWHPYVDPRWDADADETWNTCHKMRDVHDWLVSEGKPNKKIMAGEWGVPWGPASNPRKLPKNQIPIYVALSYLPAFINMNDDGCHIAVAAWYTLRDAMNPGAGWADYCGVLNKNGKPNPVAAVLQNQNTTSDAEE